MLRSGRALPPPFSLVSWSPGVLSLLSLPWLAGCIEKGNLDVTFSHLRAWQFDSQAPCAPAPQQELLKSLEQDGTDAQGKTCVSWMLLGHWM